MRHARPHLLLALLLSAACGGPPEPASAPPGARAATPASGPAKGGAFVEVRADAIRTLPSGAKLPVVKGWFLEERPDGVVLQDPEREMTVTLLEIEVETAEAAVAEAVKRLGRPAPKVERTTHDTDIAGWDEVIEQLYETPAAEARVYAMNVRRKGRIAWATLLEGKAAAFGRRGAQMKQIVGGLDVPGVADEDLSKNEPLALEGERAQAFEAFVASAREKAFVPGVAVAVVQGGKIVFEKGFGTLERGKKEPVTPRTRFMIGSVTKSLSSLLIASLVDEGKVRWDTKVKALSPGFETGDPAFTEKLTLADTFCACTGMPRRDLDFVFEYAKTKPEDTLRWFSAMKPTTGFGETFQYSNQMTALGGFVAARVAEPKKPLLSAYESAMRARVFAPMGMADTTASYAEGKKGGVALPHAASLAAGFDEPLVVPFGMESFVEPVAPAGSVFSSAHDMARYMMVELAKGKTPEGKQVFSEANLLERRKLRVRAGAKGAYGLGLGLGELHGLSIVSHDGGTFGFASRLFLVPDKGLGLVVLTNSTASGSELLDAVTLRLIELVLGGKERAAAELDKSIERSRAEWKRQTDKIGKPPAELAARLVGTWRTERLGTLVVTEDAKKGLVFDAGEWSTRVGYDKADDGVERVFFLDPPIAGLGLRVDGNELVLEFGQDSFRFARR